ncbi:LytR/AlgR family response regulator transcription factor [Floccifex sp.]|uniref:LytR/AlgR family response regulator transcription factor n=1 Tax=Floccifex sp. TaxID=2815810 RepID=UPI002A766666|nr:LytTR family DNA-binding domain-containing protein [Floccifex sp.]MDD7281872.1 LytTR family DNA-binding domain-containing protein [Erysipelotrichaceae bacterium]MDY2958115.1 LytTR family DNA-binding domain-containing protein [Floccifex sp.]
MVEFVLLSAEISNVKFIAQHVNSICGFHFSDENVFSSYKSFKRSDCYQQANVLIIDTDLKDWKEYASMFKKEAAYYGIMFIGSDLRVGYQVYDYDPIAFIYKNELNPYFDQALERIQKDLASKDQRYLNVSWRNTIYILHQSDILYLERDKRKTIIHLKDGRTYVTYTSLNGLESQLKESFMRVHFSYLVNCDYVFEYHRNNLNMVDKTFIPISRKYVKIVKKYFESRK